MEWICYYTLAWGATVGLSSFLGKVWATRISSRENHALRKELESLKGRIGKKNYVSKVRFDAEFAIYRSLGTALFYLEKKTHCLYPMFEYSTNETEEEQYKRRQNMYNEARETHNDALTTLSINCAFIPKDIYDELVMYTGKCRKMISRYPLFIAGKIKYTEEDDDFISAMNLHDDFEKIMNRIREYIDQLESY